MNVLVRNIAQTARTENEEVKSVSKSSLVLCNCHKKYKEMLKNLRTINQRMTKIHMLEYYSNDREFR